MIYITVYMYRSIYIYLPSNVPAWTLHKRKKHRLANSNVYRNIVYTKYIANVLVLLLISKICVYNIQEATVVAIEYVKIKGQGLNVVVAVVVLATQQLRCLIQGDFI